MEGGYSTVKKIMVFFLSAVFVLSYAAGAFAIHAEIPSDTQAVVGAGTTQITLGGDLRTRGWYFDNVANHMPADANSGAYYDERVRLSVDAKVTPNVEGFVQLESDTNTTFGASGVNKSTDKYYWGNFNSKPSGMTILQSWIMYSGSGLLGFPTGLKIGHMPLALGNKLFFDHTHFGDDAIVLFSNPTKDIEADLLTIKYFEGNNFVASDDLDGYVANVSYKIDDKNTVGVDYTFLNSSGSANDPLLPANSKFTLQNLELFGKGNISGLGYNYSGDVQFGKWTATQDAKGWAAMLGLNYMVDPVNIRGSFAYGSGPDLNSSDHKQFQAFLGDDQHYTLIYDYQLNTAAGARDTGVMNTTYYNLGVDVNPLKDVKASLDGYILRASKETFAGQSKNVGWEVDGRIKYQLAKNLVYQIDAGYMHAGSFYQDAANAGQMGYTAGTDVKNPVILRHLIELSF
jgi:hypothetical protein